MRDTSLEDFLDGSDDDRSESRAGEDDGSGADGEIRTGSVEPPNGAETTDGTDRAEKGEETTDGPIEPATATYAWTTDGVDCPDCGRSVERRWRDGDRFVCADCKRW